MNSATQSAVRGKTASPARAAFAGLGVIALLLAIGWMMPRWLQFLSTMAAASGIVTLGVVVLMRGGVGSFGQGMVFAAGGYAAALAVNKAGVQDGLVLIALGGVCAAAIAAPFAPLLARYRGIFFSMLTLALSMVLYGILMKTSALGGSDGFNVGRPTLVGWAIPDALASYALYALAILVAGVLSVAVRVYFDSNGGLVSLAIRENELRVEYLGVSVTAVMTYNFIVAAFIGGVGGALTVLALGHVDPNFSYWTTSGEFVFAAILAGYQSVLAVFVASFVLEMVRSFSNLYFPNTWQLALGVFLLVVIRFLPKGIGSLWIDRAARRGSNDT